MPKIPSAPLLTRTFAVTGKKFRLKDFDPGETLKLTKRDKPRAERALQKHVGKLCSYQERLYACGQHAVLIIFQAMDAAGKDGAIKHVMSGVNPQGCSVHSFKAPSSLELRHDYLWRCERDLPERGEIGIFNRSYYEEALVVRVHPELLARERIPQKEVADKDFWKHRFADIRNREDYLIRNGTTIIKFFLNVSKEEQRKRFLERLAQKGKGWKFSASDVTERAFWDSYQSAYEDMIRHTSTEEAPWYVVPADHKWFTRLVVSSVINERLRALGLAYPSLSPEQEKAFAEAKKTLLV